MVEPALTDAPEVTAVRSGATTPPAVSAETVAKIRSENASRTAPWTAAELLKIGN